MSIRWGMIGVGSVAEHKSGPAFLRAAGGSLAAVASRRHAMAEDYAARHGVPYVFSSAAALIQSGQVDAVYIATPPASHFSLALDVAKAGKPCCIEKPIAVYFRDAQELCRVFDAAGLPLFVSYYRRSLPRFRQVADLIAENAIGAISSIEWVLGRVRGASIDNNWRLNPSEAPGGLFEDLACHGLDLFDYFFGPIGEIRRSRLDSLVGQSVPTCVEAWWHHGGMIEGRGMWDFDAAARIDKVTLTGEGGTISFSIFDDAPVTINQGGMTRVENVPNPKPIQLPHVIALNKALNEGALHPSTGHSAARTAWVSEQILRGPHASAVHLRER